MRRGVDASESILPVCRLTIAHLRAPREATRGRAVGAPCPAIRPSAHLPRCGGALDLEPGRGLSGAPSWNPSIRWRSWPFMALPSRLARALLSDPGRVRAAGSPAPTPDPIGSELLTGGQQWKDDARRITSRAFAPACRLAAWRWIPRPPARSSRIGCATPMGAGRLWRPRCPRRRSTAIPGCWAPRPRSTTGARFSWGGRAGRAGIGPARARRRPFGRGGHPAGRRPWRRAGPPGPGVPRDRRPPTRTGAREFPIAEAAASARQFGARPVSIATRLAALAAARDGRSRAVRRRR